LLIFLNYLVLITIIIENIELKIAGDENERAQMMPLLYIDSDDIKAYISEQIVGVLEQYTKGNPGSPKMKPLDVVKVLMGIMSERDSVKQFKFDGKFWAVLHEYDYEQLMKLSEEVVGTWYMENIHNI